MADKALGLLGLMRRASAIEIGVDNASDALRAGRAKLLLLSCDAADNARRKLEHLSVGRRIPAKSWRTVSASAAAPRRR